MRTKTRYISEISDQVAYRNTWIENTLSALRKELQGKGCLDLGAGKKPYEKFVENLEIRYTSQDFAKYEPNHLYGGLQDDSWPDTGYDIVSDILEVKAENFDLVLLTEVLEHVVDPVAVLKVAISCLRPQGYILMTVPFNSRMHQAPYWYASGLSEFFFRDLASNLGFECVEIIQVGDFIDYWMQESKLCLTPFVKLQGLGIWLISKAGCFLRRKLDNGLLSSGGLNMLILLKKN